MIPGKTAILAFAFASALSAAETVVDGIRYTGDEKLVPEFEALHRDLENKDARHREAKKLYDQRTATLDDYQKAQTDFTDARKKFVEMEARFAVVPTVVKGTPESLSPEIMSSLYQEAGKISAQINLLMKQELDKDKRESRLKAMLAQCGNHPAEGPILMELGMLNIESYEAAEPYLNKATQSRFRSDTWDFSKQQACKELAKLHENNKQYAKAIEALERWKISEPCGTGAGASRVEKAFWIFRLALHIRPPDEVRQEMWDGIASGNIDDGFIGEGRMAEYVLSLYEGEKMAVISRDFKRARKIATAAVDHPHHKWITENFERLAKDLTKAIDEDQKNEK